MPVGGCGLDLVLATEDLQIVFLTPTPHILGPNKAVTEWDSRWPSLWRARDSTGWTVVESSFSFIFSCPEVIEIAVSESGQSILPEDREKLQNAGKSCYFLQSS